MMNSKSSYLTVFIAVAFFPIIFREKTVQDHVKQTSAIETMRSLRKEKDTFRVPKE